MIIWLFIMKNWFSKNKDCFWLLSIVVVSVVLHFWELGKQSVWIDEIFTLRNIECKWSEVLHHAYVHACCLAYCCVGVEDVDCLEVVLFAQHVVVGIVCGSYLQATCSELNFYVAVLDYRD